MGREDPGPKCRGLGPALGPMPVSPSGPRKATTKSVPRSLAGHQAGILNTLGAMVCLRWLIGPWIHPLTTDFQVRSFLARNNL